MPPSCQVQSSNVTKLCAELGFSGAYPGREEKVLTAHTLKFPVDSLSQGTPLPCFKSVSAEALQLAIQFCSENRRGQLFWPDNNHNSWPSWSLEKTKILRIIAHIFSLQAFYKYQRDRKNKKKEQTEQSTAMESSQGSVRVRELSPESRLFVAPIPPKGTRRRPAQMSSNSSNNLSPAKAGLSSLPRNDDTLDAHTMAGYIDHVESLDPKDDEGPLRSFTQRWLLKTSEWPTSADPRLYNFMHINHAYDPDNQEEFKEVALVQTMRRGTEINQTPEGQLQQYAILKDRILNRMRVLAKEMQNKKILERKHGKLDMTKAFKEVWTLRRDYWAKKAVNSVNDVPTNSYEILDLYDDDEDDCVPLALKKKASLKGKQPMTQNKNTPPKTPQRRKLDDLTMSGTSLPNSFSPYANKRQRIDPVRANSPMQGVRLSTETSNGEISGIAGVLNPIDQVTLKATAERVRCAEPGLRSPSITERLNSPPSRVGSSLAPSPIPDEPMTPTSPAPRHEIINTSGRHSSPPSPTRLAITPQTIGGHVATKDKSSAVLLSRVSAVSDSTIGAGRQPQATPSFTSTSSKASNKTPYPRVGSRSTASPSGSHPEILLTLQKRDRTWDLDTDYPASSYLGPLDLTAFFAFFSQKSGVALVDLDNLTFKLQFGRQYPQQIEVINKNGEEEEWKKLKSKIKKFFKFVRDNSPRESEFDAWVEIGNRKEIIQEMEEDLGGL